MTLTADTRVLFSTRFIRLFCYGLVAVILALYLVDVGLGERQVGLLFSLALAGDAGISLWLTTSADSVGRKRILIIGALLMLVSGLVFAMSESFAILLLAAVDRSDQPKWEGDRPVPFRGTGRSLSACPR